MDLQAALARLNAQLPLKARQARLSPALRAMHRLVLECLVTQGRPPRVDELRRVAMGEDVITGLRHLGAEDLVVLDQDGSLPLGAYPVTSETTPHAVRVNSHDIFAMCALDAVSVAPMFDTEVWIDSSCHVSHTPIVLKMQGGEILQQQPGEDVTVGIRWQMPTAVAAHSMCMQMVFLKDRSTAQAWQAGDTRNIALFSLPQAVQFGQAFFRPLLV
jgi:hypothetical protein